MLRKTVKRESQWRVADEVKWHERDASELPYEALPFCASPTFFLHLIYKT